MGIFLKLINLVFKFSFSEKISISSLSKIFTLKSTSEIAPVSSSFGNLPENKIETRKKLVTKYLKSFYAYAFNKNEFLKDHGCCRQSYTNLELLRRRDSKWIKCDRSMRDSLSLCLQIEESIDDLEDIFKHNNHVLLKGIGGVGKTYLIREIVSKWVHGCLYTDIEFLFVLNCNDAKKLPECKQLKDLMECIFQNVFELLTWREIFSDEAKVLVIFDGWGKLERLDYVQIEKVNNEFHYQPNLFGKFLFDAINSHNGLFRNSFTLTTSRPDFYLVLREGLGNLKISDIDVLGFSEESCNNFIFDVCRGNDDTFTKIKSKIEQCKGFENLMRIPRYISLFCGTHHSNENFESPRTKTEIYLWKLVLILQEKNYMLDLNKQNADIEIFNTSIMITSVFEAAQISYTAQINGTDTSDCFFIDHDMQEFLTSIYLYVLNIGSIEIKNDHRLNNCLAFVSGLHGFSSRPFSKYPCLMQNFIVNLIILRHEFFMNDLFASYLPPSKETKEHTFDNDFLTFLESYYEYQKPLSLNKSFMELVLQFKLHDMLPRDINNLIHFLSNESYQLNILSIEIHTHQPIKSEEMLMLCPLLLIIPIVKFDLKSISQCSQTFVDILMKAKSVDITLKELHILQKYDYNIEIEISLNLIFYFKNLHIFLFTNRNCNIIQNLKNLIPIVLKENKNIRLETLKLTIATSDHKILQIILDLLPNLLFLKELYIDFTEHQWQVACRPYENHRTVKSIDVIEISSIKQALYKGFYSNNLPANLRKFCVKNSFAEYQFIVNKFSKQIVFSSDKIHKKYVEVDVL